MPKFLADELGFSLYFKEAQTDMVDGVARRFGNAIVSRYPLTRTDFVYIQDPLDPERHETDYSKEGRVYVEVDVEAPSGTVTIGTAHMSYTDRFVSTAAKEIETDKLCKVFEGKRSRFVFTGDLNSLPDSYTITEVEKRLKNCGPEASSKTWTTKPFSYNKFEANTLDWRLDYCFATPDIQVRSAQVVQTQYSDHLPILVEFDFI